MVRVLFTTIGSWGDLFPVIGVGLEMQDRGHTVEVAASPAWHDVVENAGLTFVPVGRRIGFDDFARNPEIFGPMPFALRTVLQRFLFDQIDELAADLEGPIERSDLVVSHPAHVAALNVAERLRAPSAVATVFPAMLPSAYRVPGGTPLGPWTGPIGRLANRLTWVGSSIGSAVMFDRPVNAHRRSLGLPPVRNAILNLQLRTQGVIVLSDPGVIEPPLDWPPSVTMASFVEWDKIDAAEATADVQDFIDGGAPPVLVTLGTSTSTVAGDFFEHATRTLLDRGERVLTVTGPAPKLSDIAPGRSLSVDYVPYSAVLAQCRAIVHHAGIGTTLASMRAGLPQVAVPKSHDQPDTARLIERAGVGVKLSWRRRGRALGTALNRILAEPEFEATAKRLSRTLAGRNGAHLAADAIEELVGDNARPR